MNAYTINLYSIFNFCGNKLPNPLKRRCSSTDPARAGPKRHLLLISATYHVEGHLIYMSEFLIIRTFQEFIAFFHIYISNALKNNVVCQR